MVLAAAPERGAQGQGDGEEASPRCSRRRQGPEKARPWDREEGGLLGFRKLCTVGHAEDDRRMAGVREPNSGVLLLHWPSQVRGDESIGPCPLPTASTQACGPTVGAAPMPIPPSIPLYLSPGKLDHSWTDPTSCICLSHPSRHCRPRPLATPICLHSAHQPSKTSADPGKIQPLSRPAQLSDHSHGESCCRCRGKPAGRGSCSAGGSG